jgi:hypothetical protein
LGECEGQGETAEEQVLRGEADEWVRVRVRVRVRVGMGVGVRVGVRVRARVSPPKSRSCAEGAEKRMSG